MKNQRLCFLLAIIVSTLNLKAQNTNDTLGENKSYNNFRIGVATGVLAGSYYYLENIWWKDNHRNFHFDGGADLTYALNVDKAAHFMGGMLVSEFAYEQLRSFQKNKKKAIWQSAGIGFLTQFAIEIKDGYAPYWGFSFGDLLSGGAGSLFFAGKKLSSSLKMVEMKFSYWRHSDSYFDLETQRNLKTGEPRPNEYLWHEDYPNQTYWISFNIKELTENEDWPDYLNIAIGFGLDDKQELNNNLTKTGGSNELYLAIDYNVPKLFKRYNTTRARKIKKWLNYFKFPAPTIQVYPTIKIFPFFL
ncbi:MAG: hypothetical protein VX347_01585 [Bacteroidota bacterium]|nr:hypothetical protein [Bacteroidota bacterium]